MNTYHKFYIKQINLELEVVQPIYVQKIMIGHVGWLTIEDSQDVFIFCTLK